ncbi:DUF2066 domain-containing protein [Bradyrhizobium sp. ARR65]|uniref:DUF2066 domain-containing protein n=1 Tax=Bradyrhizobium sp. ARR65 TaxID=1040989 RepID=UPI001FD9CF10|nr:DUF2066 domain-containing protein [Bradyrhizobium sp. ARR65]
MVTRYLTDYWRQVGARRAAHRLISALLALVATCWCGTMATAADSLYRAQAVVTGQGEPNRTIGFGVCLEDVLIKVSGAQKLAGDPRLAAYKAKASDYVRAYSYHDQMAGTPTRDEQGTRDRPYDLSVEFDEGKVDALLRTLGLNPWLSHRPVLAVFVVMEQGARKYMVTSDARQSDLQRESLLGAAMKRGMSVVLPSSAALEKLGVTLAEASKAASSQPASAAAELGGEVALAGHLVWSDQELGWATEWQIDWQGRQHRWQLRGVTFDEAFRRGLGGAAQILSGNGDP